MPPKTPVEELREKVAGIDRLAAQAIAMLTEQVATNSRHVEQVARDLAAMRGEIHNLDLKITQIGNAELRDRVSDHESRIRLLQDWKSHMVGRQTTISAIIAGGISVVVAIAMKLVHP